MRRQLSSARTLAELPADARGVPWREWILGRLDAIHAAGKRRHFERVQAAANTPMKPQQQDKPVFGRKKAS